MSHDCMCYVFVAHVRKKGQKKSIKYEIFIYIWYVIQNIIE